MVERNIGKNHGTLLVIYISLSKCVEISLSNNNCSLLFFFQIGWCKMFQIAMSYFPDMICAVFLLKINLNCTIVSFVFEKR